MRANPLLLRHVIIRSMFHRMELIMIKLALLILAFGLSNQDLRAQQTPIYSQFFLNPYVYNPAYAGFKERPVAFLTHRRQWIGIEGAPVTSTFSFHTPLKKNLALGTNIYQDERSLLKATSLQLSIAYKAKLGDQQYIRFGLSGGFAMNNLELANINDPAILNDPALFDLVDNNFNPSGSFGINYHMKGLNLSFGLPSLFRREVIGINEFEPIELDPVKNYNIMANYRFGSEEGIAFEPHLIYRVTETLPEQLEALGVVYIKDLVWVGGSYRQDYGVTGLFGFKIKDFLSVGYAYELATSQVDGIPDGTHEFQLSINLGKKKSFEKRPPKDREYGNRDARFYSNNDQMLLDDLFGLDDDEEEYEEIPEEIIQVDEMELWEEDNVEDEFDEELQPNSKEVSGVELPTELKESTPKVSTDQDPGRSYHEQMESDHYVILQTLDSFEAAYDYWANLINYYGYRTEFGYNPEDKKYHVYIAKTSTEEEAKEELEKTKQFGLFDDAYYMEIK
ncbi:MAG: PorP/SprF family type IX secretion system membrane protein [Cyclobacteriaceae bacterium]